MNNKPFLTRLADNCMAGFVAFILACLLITFTAKAAPTALSRIFSGVTKFTGAILAQPAGTANSDTNGFIRLTSPNGSNTISWLTNGQLVFNFNGVLKTGFSGTIMTNTVSMMTQSWFGGAFLGTNQTAGSIPSSF